MTATEPEHEHDDEIATGPDVELEPDGDGDQADTDELGDEPESEPEQRIPSSVTTLAQRDKDLASETRRHEKALRRIYGDDFEGQQPCPLCLTDGWIYPAPPGAIEPEQWSAILLAAGQDAPVNYETAPYAEPCPTCKAKGQLATGSEVPNQAVLPCRDCNGQGWREKIQTVAYQPPSLVIENSGNGTTTGYNLDGPKDQWGRPSGHPHYGIEPAYVS